MIMLIFGLGTLVLFMGLHFAFGPGPEVHFLMHFFYGLCLGIAAGTIGAVIDDFLD